MTFAYIYLIIKSVNEQISNLRYKINVKESILSLFSEKINLPSAWIPKKATSVVKTISQRTNLNRSITASDNSPYENLKAQNMRE